ncbi:MAG: hypothetical protein ACT6T3_21880, partial [Agrobacterium sp.]|uniref:hypothetical protein n=1 Tax=Agrobacterium sp. TaxID=361 RepID=UPI00403392DD
LLLLLELAVSSPSGPLHSAALLQHMLCLLPQLLLLLHALLQLLLLLLDLLGMTGPRPKATPCPSHPSSPRLLLPLRFQPLPLQCQPLQ